jgi:protein SCO1/2
MQKKYFRAGILFLVLGVPVFVFLFLKFFGNNKFDLPHYFPELAENGEVKIVAGDTLFIKVPDFKLFDQDSIELSFNQGQIRVVGFFFSRCGTICPVTNKNILRVAENFKKSKDLQILSITVDPKYDTPHILKLYSQTFGFSGDNWKFLTGDKKYIYDLCIKGFKLPVSDASQYDSKISNVDQTFIHSDRLLLIDKENHIRGIYEGTNVTDIDRLMVEIKVLLKNK